MMVRSAWAMLAGTNRQVEPGRARLSPDPPLGDDPELPREGFADEALPWLGAVYRFALRLTRGDEEAAEDLTQETFLRAYRAWDRFERGTNARSWLFTICRNAFLKEREKASTRREISASSFPSGQDGLSSPMGLPTLSSDRDPAPFWAALDDRVVNAIDGLPEDYREVLILSDLGDLRYGEIAEVLEIPVGTVKSRLFRARRILQEQLLEFAMEEGYVKGKRSNTREER